MRCAVGLVLLRVVVEAIAETGLRPVDLPVHGLGVGVQQQLGGVAPLALRRVIGSVHPVAVQLSRLNALEIAVPDERVDLGQLDAGLLRSVEQAELDVFGDLAEDGKVRARTVERRAERVRLAGPDEQAVSTSCVQVG